MEKQQLQFQDNSSNNDPNIAQRSAADPKASIWVSASAGTGKTKVLTDRLLRLMLPHHDGSEASEPHRILCLTFTKNAAAEMKTRFTETLRQWSTMDEPSLAKALKSLFGEVPTTQQLKSAQSLFAKVVDTPGGLKIMTIHSFCQSILGRFPLEAGLSPNMEVIEETEQTALLERAFHFILKTFHTDQDSDGNAILERLLRLQTEKDLLTLCKSIYAEKEQFETLFTHYGDITKVEEAIFEVCEADKEKTADDILDELHQHILQKQSDYETLESAFLNTNSVKDEKKATLIRDVLNAKQVSFDQIYSIFFTPSTGNQYKPTKTFAESYPALLEIFEKEAALILRVKDKIAAQKLATYTADIMFLAKAVLSAYTHYKKNEAFLDFDDLIHYTAKLLSNHEMSSSAAWVMYKLDGGLDHILVDEAQDTNPEQWSIIDALATEFFSGETARPDLTRTLFVVGDGKQSIFSFQRADPESFQIMRDRFSAKIQDAKQQWRSVLMNTSFRTTQGILDHVDQVFADIQTKHVSFREGQASHIEIWPLFENQKTEKLPPWSPPTQIIETEKAGPKLAQKIAETISEWIEKKRILPSRGRAIRPSDVMILVRSRTVFVNQLIRALKAKQIPVSGADRMVISNEIATQDLLCALRFGLLPDDDLNLATLLKSPFINMSEENLFELSHNRKGKLWHALKENKNKEIIEWCEGLINIASSESPFAALNMILFSACPASETSALQALIKRLGFDVQDIIEECIILAQDYELNHVATLQGFIKFMDQQTTPLKKDIDLANDTVQIITAHGAKGLQAPIIFMPDTTRTAGQAIGKIDKLLWPKQTKLPVPLWAAHNGITPQIYLNAKEQISLQEDAEYRRLLYVAMTRAEDELYICGVKKHQKYLNWYDETFDALSKLDETEETQFNEEGHTKLVYAVKQNGQPDRVKNEEEVLHKNLDTLPSWIKEAAPIEVANVRPLNPSKPEETEPSTLSPLTSSQDYRFQRGNLTHALLQFLPDIEMSKRESIAKEWLSAQDISEDIQESIQTEVIDILNNPDYAPLFGPGSQAEVPITGLIDGKVLSGQIDRLLITDTEIWIIDYKSNRPSPKNPQDVPDIYKKQMQAYAKALENIYPNRIIKTFLLWTDTATLMAI